MKFIIPALLEFLKWHFTNIPRARPTQMPPTPTPPPWLLRMKESLLSLVVTAQMCHWASQEHFYCKLCCFHRPQFQSY